MTKPIFIALRTEHFRAFESGAKTVEYRKLGARWNERTCAVGRPVTLSHGYSGARLHGRVTSFTAVLAADIASTIYPPDVQLAAIEIELLPAGSDPVSVQNSQSAVPPTPSRVVRVEGHLQADIGVAPSTTASHAVTTAPQGDHSRSHHDEYVHHSPPQGEFG